MKPRSPHDKAGGMAWFPRMLDKIRIHARGELDADYHANLGNGMDGFCLAYLRIDHAALTARVLEGGSDEGILAWCFANGRELNHGDLFVWNNFVTRVGWNDFASKRLAAMKIEFGLAHRDDIRTIPDLIDLDEGRRA
jgi:gluconokinase